VNVLNLKKRFQKCLKVGQKNGRIMLQNVEKNFCFFPSFMICLLASEYGSTASAWKAIMGDADASAEVHQTVHDELQNDIIPTVKSWQKTKYVKSMMHIKPIKDLDEEFKRVGFFFFNLKRKCRTNYILGTKTLGEIIR
jgi:hypothetical protein